MRAVNWSPETRIEQWRNRPSSFPQSQLFERGLALMKNFTRRSTIAGVATLALVGTGIAFAAWTSTGTGSGTADATNAVNLTVNVGNASGLYPTGSKTATFTVTNPNPYAVKLTGADAATNFGVDAGHSGCNLSFAVQRRAEPDRRDRRRRSRAARTPSRSRWTTPPTTSARVRTSRST